MAEHDGLGERFEEHRTHLLAVAYRMLGSLGEAEDAVQEAWLRIGRADQNDIEDARAFLVRVTTRLAIDRLRRLKVWREAYVGPWLPEPILTDRDAGETVELAESVSLALPVVLETLSPLERAVFVLREAFGYSYADIGETVGRNEAMVRQLARRAREHVQQRRPRFDADQATRRRVTEHFLAACNNGDVDALMAILAPGVTLYGDSGGRVCALRRPTVGADKVMRFFSVWRKPYRGWAGVVEGTDFELPVVQVNDGPTIRGTAGERPIRVLTLAVADGVVQALRFVAKPDKLAGPSREATTSRGEC